MKLLSKFMFASLPCHDYVMAGVIHRCPVDELEVKVLGGLEEAVGCAREERGGDGAGCCASAGTGAG